MVEGRKESAREGDAGSVADLARRRTNSGAPSATTGYAAHNMSKKNVQTADRLKKHDTDLKLLLRFKLYLYYFIFAFA